MQPQDPNNNQTPTPVPTPVAPGPVFGDVAATQPNAPEPVTPPAGPAFMQPPTAAPPTQPVSASNPPSGDYPSNPFKATSLGLGRALTVNPVSSLSTGFIALLLIFGASLLLGLLSALLPGIAKVLVTIVGLLFTLWLMFRAIASIVVIHLASARGETLTGRDAFGSGSSKGFVSFILTTVMSAILIIIGLVLLIVPGFILIGRLALAPFVVYDEQLGAVAAIKRSWALTKGHTWEMMGAFFATLFVNGSTGGLISFIGSQAANANRYTELKAAEQAQRATGKTHWANYVTTILSLIGIIIYASVMIWIVSHVPKTSTSSFGTTSPSSSTSTSDLFSGNDYCYSPSNYTSTNLDTKCVTKSECQQVTACAKIYSGADSSTSTFQQ